MRFDATSLFTYLLSKGLPSCGGRLAGRRRKNGGGRQYTNIIFLFLCCVLPFFFFIWVPKKSVAVEKARREERKPGCPSLRPSQRLSYFLYAGVRRFIYTTSRSLVSAGRKYGGKQSYFFLVEPQFGTRARFVLTVDIFTFAFSVGMVSVLLSS